VNTAQPPHTHIIGAGLAGLAAGVRLARQGVPVTLYETSPRAGGRCRSYHDTQLDCVIDNGNHLMMSGNHAVMDYLAEIGAADRLSGPTETEFPFVDVEARTRWSLKPGAGIFPWWIFDPTRRVPRTGPFEYMSVIRLLAANATDTVADCIGSEGTLYRNFWEPLTVAALNADPKVASAQLMRPVLTETFLRGANACRPLVARNSLANTLIDPALDVIKSAGAIINFGCRVRSLAFKDNHVESLVTDSGHIHLTETDTVICAVPAWTATSLVPDLAAPGAGEPIVNVHYRLARPLADEGDVKIVGVIGGLAQWVFVRSDLASVTISAAADVVDQTAEIIAAVCWKDVALALELEGEPEPPSRVVKERRATFAQDPVSAGLRPKSATKYPNLLLAGDWTATGVPATIEGAVRSGFRAAALALGRHRTSTPKTTEQQQDKAA